MALATGTVWEIRANGTATGGGGFVATGTDRSQQDAVHATFTDLVIDGTTNTDITSATIPFASDDVGNIVNITSGTGFTTGRYEVKSVASTVATMDRSVGTLSSTGGNGVLGGAMTLIDANLEDLAAGNTAWIANDATHTLSANIAMAQAGAVSTPIRIIGYNTSRDDLSDDTGTRPLVAAGANSFTFDGSHIQVSFLNVTTTASNGLNLASTEGKFIYCKSNNTSGSARNAIKLSSTTNFAILCEGQSTNGDGFNVGADGTVTLCYTHDSGNRGIFTNGDNITIISCVIDTCAEGIRINTESNIVINCTIYNSSGTGLRLNTGSESDVIINVIFDNCGTGLDGVSSADTSHNLINCNFSNNSTDKANWGGTSINETALAPGFTDAPNGDFTVGSNMQSAGAPFPGGLTAAAINIGLAQNKSGGGGGTIKAGAGLQSLEGGYAAI